MLLRVGFDVSKAQARLSVSLLLLSMDLVVELSVTSPEPCLSSGSYTPSMMIVNLTCETVSKSQLNIFVFKHCNGYGVSFQ